MEGGRGLLADMEQGIKRARGREEEEETKGRDERVEWSGVEERDIEAGERGGKESGRNSQRARRHGRIGSATFGTDAIEHVR